MQWLHRWFATGAGQELADQETRLISRRLAGLYAQRVLQVGDYGGGRCPTVVGGARLWILDTHYSGQNNLRGSPEVTAASLWQRRRRGADSSAGVRGAPASDHPGSGAGARSGGSPAGGRVQPDEFMGAAPVADHRTPGASVDGAISERPQSGRLDAVTGTHPEAP